MLLAEVGDTAVLLFCSKNDDTSVGAARTSAYVISARGRR